MLKFIRIASTLAVSTISILSFVHLSSNSVWAKGGHGGTVSVHGYYRSNGTYVAPYTRSAPGSSGGVSGGTINTTTETSTGTSLLTQDKQWLTAGESNNGSVLAIDVNSVRVNPRTKDLVWFKYRVTNPSETYELVGVTTACSNGKITHDPMWLAPVTVDGKLELLNVQADSPASNALLNRVCQIGNEIALRGTNSNP